MQSACQNSKNFFPFIYRVILFLIIRHRVQNATFFAKCNAKCYTVNLCTVYFAVIALLCLIIRQRGVLSSKLLIEIVSQFAGVVHSPQKMLI